MAVAAWQVLAFCVLLQRLRRRLLLWRLLRRRRLGGGARVAGSMPALCHILEQCLPHPVGEGEGGGGGG